MKTHKVGTRVRVTECSGLDSGKIGVVISAASSEATPVAADYPFVAGRTPKRMGWNVVRFTDDSIGALPANRLEAVNG